MTVKPHQPKGGMCMNCQRQNLDCSDLPFDEMAAIKIYHDAVVVRCTSFERKSNE